MLWAEPGLSIYWSSKPSVMAFLEVRPWHMAWFGWCHERKSPVKLVTLQEERTLSSMRQEGPCEHSERVVLHHPRSKPWLVLHVAASSWFQMSQPRTVRRKCLWHAQCASKFMSTWQSQIQFGKGNLSWEDAPTMLARVLPLSSDDRCGRPARWWSSVL